MTNQRGPVVLVTGATDGIGRETAVELARRGARLIVHGRSASRLGPTLDAIRSVHEDSALEPLVCDLSHLAEIRTVGDTLGTRGVQVDVLVNNAGVYMREPQKTEDGFEVTLAVNYLAPFALSHLLLASEAGRGLKRIVNVSSMAHTRGSVAIDDLSFERRGFDPYATYAASKLALVMFTVELARRLGHRPPTVNSLHPGVVSTKLLTEGFGFEGRDSLAEGAATSVRLALDSDLAETSGGYFSGGRPSPMNRQAEDLGALTQLYELTAKLTGVPPLAASGSAAR